jgi:FAD/FMN-containing dehydrogenase
VLLPYGNGRSYGDSCQNQNGVLVDTRPLNRLISFNRETGVLRAESGILLDDILRLIVPSGWFLPVVPGTRFITLGGAIANDVHGKNHHRSGSFGCHVTAFELLRSTGERLTCTQEQNPDWFKASIGGLGLTGLITWAEIALKPVPSAFVDVTTTRFANLGQFFVLNEQAEAAHEYTVAWIDCLAKGQSLGRGVFMAGDHATGMARRAVDLMRPPSLSVPIDAPHALLNRFTLSTFNAAYYRFAKPGHKVSHFAPYFFPLDGIGHWNRLYGSPGFYQYQCVVPKADANVTLAALLERIANSGQGSFLAVLKGFGNLTSPGMLSFPRPGYTLALDFPNRGDKTLKLFETLDQIVDGAGGALYPAKDARMSADGFARYFPQVDRFRPYIDPRFSSDFWCRVQPQSQ